MLIDSEFMQKLSELQSRIEAHSFGGKIVEIKLNRKAMDALKASAASHKGYINAQVQGVDKISILGIEFTQAD